MFAILRTIPEDPTDFCVHGPYATKQEARKRATELGEMHLREIEGGVLDANEEGTDIWIWVHHECNENDEPYGGVVWTVMEMQH